MSGKFFKLLGFGLFCFVFFLYLEFPYEVFLPQIHAKILPKITPDRSISFEATRVKPYWLTGVTLENFVLNQGGKTLFEAKSVSARLRILPLLLNMRSVGFSADAYAGNLSGWVGQRKKTNSGSIKLKNIDLKKLIEGVSKKQMPVSGLVKGTIKFDLVPTNVQQSKIDTALLLEKGKLGPGSLQGFTLPSAIRLDNKNNPLPIKLTMDKGFLSPQIKMANADGRLEIEGRIIPNLPIAFSQLDLQLTFFLENKIKDEMPAILFDTLLAPGKNSDGSFSFKLMGPLQNPRFEPFRK